MLPQKLLRNKKLVNCEMKSDSVIITFGLVHIFRCLKVCDLFLCWIFLIFYLAFSRRNTYYTHTFCISCVCLRIKRWLVFYSLRICTWSFRLNWLRFGKKTQVRITFTSINYEWTNVHLLLLANEKMLIPTPTNKIDELLKLTNWKHEIFPS